jgi:indolepyruvate ferredoxin oxidoreductase alpha subunit
MMTLAYTGIIGGMVIVNADDPSLFSSQNEQDNRYYARLSGLPMLEPTNTQEMKEMTIAAFDLSEELELPVILRTTTRLNHIRGPVTLGELKPFQIKAHFQKDPFRFVTVPAVSRRLHKVLLERYDQSLEKSEKSSYNEVKGSGKWGIIANGASYNYVNDAVNDLRISDRVSILKIGFSSPLPRELSIKFMKQVDKVLVVEELEPIMETELKALAQENGITIPIKGKGVNGFSRLYEYHPRMVRKAVAEYFEVDYQTTDIVDISDIPDLPERPPTLCAGCPHRATYYSIKEVFGADAINPTDIGCYTLGLLKPLSMGDLSICMGASVSSSCGFSGATDQEVVSFIGDSTFFHSGITGLINGVHNNHKFTLVIMDNRTTAMTGHQPHPGADTEQMGIERTMISIEDVVRGCGVKDIHVVKPLNTKKTIESVRKAMEYDGISVIISKEVCPLFAKAVGQKKKARPFYINTEKCKNHRLCIDKLACPAMFLDGDKVSIDKNLCIGCTLCAQICPENAISPLK